MVLFFKQKTSYEMRISDWSSDVCSSDLQIMDRLQAMQVFIAVVELGSQSAAAEHLDLSRPVVSRYLAELEDWVGARLMHRPTRTLSLTAAGLEILTRCRELLELSGHLPAAVRTPHEADRESVG